MLSEESIIKRRRRNTIGLQITIISWSLEFLASITLVSKYWILQSYHNEHWNYTQRQLVSNILKVLEALTILILIPSSYLLNSEANKLRIMANGWITMCTKQRIENDERGPPVEHPPMPQPIPSISGNIRALFPNNNNASYAHTMQILSEQIINPDKNTRQDHKRGTVREKHHEKKKRVTNKTDKKTTKVKLKNTGKDRDASYQTKRQLNRGVLIDKLINTSDCNLSDITKNLPIQQKNLNLSTRKICKPLIKNAEPSVSNLCGNANIPQNSNLDTINAHFLLPNQVDYS